MFDDHMVMLEITMGCVWVYEDMWEFMMGYDGFI